MSPSQTIVHQAQATFTATDEKGRKLLLRRLTALDTLRAYPSR